MEQSIGQIEQKNSIYYSNNDKTRNEVKQDSYLYWPINFYDNKDR